MLTEAWRDHRKLRFLVVGLWNTVFAYVAFGAVYLVFQGEVHYLLICVFAHLLAVANAFICQRRFVFRSSTPWWPAFLRFNVVQLAVLAWGLAGLALMVEVFHMSPFFAQLAVMTVGIVASYLLNRSYSFRESNETV